MAIKIDFEKEERAIELPNGEILDIPARAAEQYEKILDIEKNRKNKKEYDFYAEILTELFGKDGYKKIAPKGKKADLDYLAKVYIVAIDVYMQDKTELEKQELEKQMEGISSVTETMKTLNPLLNKIK